MAKKKKLCLYLPIKIYDMVVRLAPLFDFEGNPEGNRSEVIRAILVDFYDSPKHKEWLKKLQERYDVIRFELMMEKAKLESNNADSSSSK